MQEIRRDGTEVLSAGVTIADVLKALENPDNLKVAIYPAGSVIQSQGKRYFVAQDGSLVTVPDEVIARAETMKKLREMFSK
jgi:hypothetical protein